MAKHKYSQKKEKSDVVDAPEIQAEETVVIASESNSEPMTKRAKRRVKEAEEKATATSTESKPAKVNNEKVVTSDKYNKTMTTTQNRSAKPQASNQRKGIETKKPVGKKISLWFRAMKAELKAVSWPSFKSTAKVTGVWANIGTVFLVVFFFLIVVTAFDTGLTALLKLLVGIGA